jgi:LCP family protein required for cell wall assembly
MTPKSSRPKPTRRAPKARPGQDIITSKQAAQFPGIGMTLPGYTSSSGKPRKGLTEPPQPKNGRVRRLLKKITLKRTVITLVLAVLIVGGWLSGKVAYDLHKLFGGSLFSIFSTTKLKGEDSGRVNILLAGNSADDPGHNGANLTDSIMVVSIDTKNNTAFLLSIPRDLWVQTDNNGWQKINDAYVDGQNNGFSAPGYPNGGMGELEQIVSQKLGIPIDYYALINYAAIKDAVDAVGGITVDIQSSDPRGIYDPDIDYATHTVLADYTNGEHTLNGEQALDLARARGEAYGSYGFEASDFARTQYQREMLVSLKEKADSVGVLANPAKLSSLADAIGNNVTTDFNLSQVHRLYDITKPIKGSRIQSLSLNDDNGKDLLTNYNADGQDSLIPALGVNNYSAIQAFVAQQISGNAVAKEDASVVLLNGTDTYGLATSVKSRLVSQNFSVSQIGNASTANQVTTSIIDNSGGKKPATKAALAKIFGNNFTTVNPYSAVYSADFIVVLGTDQASAASTNQTTQ